MSYIVAQLGARMHYAVPRLLYAMGQLEHFYTDICAGKRWPRLLRALPKALRPSAMERLVGRVPEGIPPECLTAFTSFGLHYFWRQAAARSRGEISSSFLWAGTTFCELVLRRGLGTASGVYAFNSAALELLQAARAAGRRGIMEQTVAPETVIDTVLHQEQQRFPDWQAPLAVDQWRDALAARERAEWDAADLIICGSEFVRDSIAACGGPAERCRVVPYGVDVRRYAFPPRAPHGGPVRVLTVGEVGLRKGSPYVLEAARCLKGRAVFRMIGRLGVLPPAQAKLAAAVELTGPVPRAEIGDHLAWADLFLLPSLCEGSATAVYEALAAQLPVICTPNTGSVVRHGVDGFIVPIRDADAIVEAVALLAADPARRAGMGLNAGQRAAEFTLEHYGSRLLAALRLEHAGA